MNDYVSLWSRVRFCKYEFNGIVITHQLSHVTWFIFVVEISKMSVSNLLARCVWKISPVRRFTDSWNEILRRENCNTNKTTVFNRLRRQGLTWSIILFYINVIYYINRVKKKTLSEQNLIFFNTAYEVIIYFFIFSLRSLSSRVCRTGIYLLSSLLSWLLLRKMIFRK